MKLYVLKHSKRYCLLLVRMFSEVMLIEIFNEILSFACYDGPLNNRCEMFNEFVMQSTYWGVSCHVTYVIFKIRIF